MFTYKRLLELGEEITIEDEILKRAVESFEGAALKFSEDMINDARERDRYNRNVKRVKELMLAEVKAGRASVIEAAEHCYQLRNQFLAEARLKTSPQGLAIVESMKKVPPTMAKLMNDKAKDFFGKKFDELTPKERAKVYYALVESSARPRVSMNALNKVLKVTGKVMIVVTAVYAINAIAQAENKTKETIKQGAVIAGGAAATAIAGPYISLMCGPAAPFCVVGSLIVAGAAGGWLALKAVEYYDEELEEFTKWDLN